MAGKKKVEKESSSWVGEVEKYSRQIWLAGLGAYSKISNDGSKLFETLVKDGEKAEKAEKAAKTNVDEQVDAVKSTAKSAKSRVGDVKERVMGKWDELEEAFDKRLNSAISRLGVPSRNEVKALHQQVDTLTKQIEKLTGASVTSVSRKAPAAKAAAKPLAKAAAKPAAKPTAKTAAAKPAAAKPAAKPAAAKKPAVKKPAAAKPVAPAKSASAPVASAAPALTAVPTPTPAPTSAATPAPVAAPAPTPISQS
ncbi:phasin family protein [Pseudomonas sp. LS1212]|uniref:phasin family protein n=1 Tax=Pseudomonas sp. LS1212 TaxID=2972478 RepID=UPI00215C0040|nr:phasin family protein [Pseudomonas sp. LS1212]UVJ44376.1 phasin family protein [Pseudomonas sp. LS1212]